MVSKQSVFIFTLELLQQEDNSCCLFSFCVLAVTQSHAEWKPISIAETGRRLLHPPQPLVARLWLTLHTLAVLLPLRFMLKH